MLHLGFGKTLQNLRKIFLILTKVLHTLTRERNTGEAPHRVPVFHDILLMHFPANWRLHKALLAGKVTVIRRVF